MGGIIRINLVTEDAVLAKRFHTYCAREKSIHAVASLEPIDAGATDLYILPVDLLQALVGVPSRRAVAGIPIIAYGEASALRGAFLAGCADYLREPWSLEELAVRARKLVSVSLLSLLGVDLNLTEVSVESRYGRAELSLQEQLILRALLRQTGTVVSREALQYALWGKLPDGRSRVVDVHVSSLRRKLQKVLPEEHTGQIILSVKGIGYVVPSEPTCRS